LGILAVGIAALEKRTDIHAGTRTSAHEHGGDVIYAIDGSDRLLESRPSHKLHMQFAVIPDRWSVIRVKVLENVSLFS